jgi:hypothetical protein
MGAATLVMLKCFCGIALINYVKLLFFTFLEEDVFFKTELQHEDERGHACDARAALMEVGVIRQKKAASFFPTLSGRGVAGFI